MRNIFCIFLFYMLCLPVQICAGGSAAYSPQDEVPEGMQEEEGQMLEGQAAEVYNNMELIMQQVNGIGSNISVARKKSYLNILQQSLDALNAQWNILQESQQNVIVASPELMEMLADYNQQFTIVGDSIKAQERYIGAMDDFNDSWKAIEQSKNAYLNMKKKALMLSLTPKTAPQLERLKAEEQVMFQNITQSLERAKAAALMNKDVAQKMPKLEAQYVELQTISKTIQEAVYKPLMLRIKDYLISFACIAILMMFVSMAVAKIKAMKAARDAAKKYQDMMNKNNQEYPTI